MIKSLYLLLLVVIIGVSSFFIYNRRESYASVYAAMNPCKKPITFRVDSVDTRFGLSQDDVIRFAEEAAVIWNRGVGRNLFVYSDDGTISVNMVFDSRQQASNKINKLDKNVDTEKSKLDSMIREHQIKVVDFKKRLAEHNKTVDEWNRRGGAPQDEYEKLVYEQEALANEAESLNSEAKELDIASEDYNLQVGELNSAIADFNRDLNVKPEEGLYIGAENRIEIYFNINQDELVHTIAHEFGHARGIDHNNDSSSIMYPYSTTDKTLSSQDISGALDACHKKTLFEVLETRLNL